MNCSRFEAPAQNGVHSLSQSSSASNPIAAAATNIPGQGGLPDAWGQYTFSPGGKGYEIYSNYTYPSWTAGIQAYGNAMGVNFAYATEYSQMDTPWSEQWAGYGNMRQVGGTGILGQPAPYGGTALIPVLGFTMWTMDQKMTFNTIPSGNYDFVFQKILNDYNSAGVKVVHFRPQYEFNLGGITQTGTPNNPALFASTGSYDPATGTGGTPSPFVLAWQHMVTAMRAQAAANGQKIYFHWNPAVNMDNGFDMRAAYPGNDYVDYIGLDIYDSLSAGGWAINGSGQTTALPMNWPGYATLAAGSAAQLAGGTFALNSNVPSAQNVEAWADDIDNQFHSWDYPGGSQWNPTGQSRTWATGMMSIILFAQQMNKGISFPETGLGIQYAGVGQAGGLSGGNPGQWFWNGGGLSPWNQNGTNFPAYLKSRIAWAQSLGLDVVFVSNFVADYGSNTCTNQWLGWSTAIGDSYKKVFGATYPNVAH